MNVVSTRVIMASSRRFGVSGWAWALRHERSMPCSGSHITGMEHSPTSATGTAWGDAVARGAAGGVGVAGSSLEPGLPRVDRPEVYYSGDYPGASGASM
jgi:hypothetical protein